MIENLFSTPVATYDLKPHFRDFEASTETMIRKFPQRITTNAHDFPPEFFELRDLMRSFLDLYREEIGLTERLSIFNGFFNEHQFGQLNTPHGHPYCLAVAVYYLRTLGKGHGDILLHDPRGFVTWKNSTDHDQRGLESYRAFKRITPETGQMIIFPAYVVHSVEPNLLKNLPTRLSIGVNAFSQDFLHLFSKK